MAKGGTNLNPGADATLVNAAYAAAMANVPKDLSGTFEALATNYATTMKSVASSWEGVAKSVGTLGRAAIGQAVTNLNNRAVVAGVSSKTNTTFLTDGLKDVKKNIFNTWKLKNEDGTANNPLSALNRGKRIEARQQRDKFFAQAKSITAGSTYLSENFAAETVDENATGVENLMLANGIQSLSTSSGKSDDGSYLKPSHDKNKNIVFTLYGADDKPITGFIDGKPVSVDGEVGVSVNADGINGLITPKNDDVATGFNALMTSMEVSAKNSNTSATFDNFAPKLKNDIRPLINTENKLHVAMGANIYNFSETFSEDLYNPEGSVTSATIFGMMNNTIPEDANGNPLPVDEMADGTAGITSADFTTGEAGAANYKLLANALTNKSNKHYNYDTTKEVFLSWAEQGAKSAFDYGVSQRKAVPLLGKSNIPETDNIYGIPKDGLLLGDMNKYDKQTLVPQYLVTDYINDIKSGSNFKFLMHNYSYKEGNWYENYGTERERKYETNKEMTDDVFQTGGKYFNNLETALEIDPTTGDVYGAEENKADLVAIKAGTLSQYSTPEMRIDLGFMNKSNTSIIEGLNDLLPPEAEAGNEKGYKFDELGPDLLGLFNQFALKDNEGNVLRYPENHENKGDAVIIKLGRKKTLASRKKAIQTLDDILETFGFNKYINTSGSESNYSGSVEEIVAGIDEN